MINHPPIQISAVVEQLPQAASIYINQMVYDLRRSGQDVITLSLGEAFFDIPLFDFNKLDVARAYHYSDSQGIPELRNIIAQYYRDYYGVPVDGSSEVLISAGSKPIVYMSMLVALNPGDEVLLHEPAWLSYPEQARLAGATARFIPYHFRPEQFASVFTPATKIVIICNPNNPAGRLYSEADIRVIYEACRRRGIYMLVDEAYSDFVLDEPFPSAAKLVPDKDGVIVVNSLSKNLGMSGWRIGYAVANPTFIKGLLKVNQHIITCASTILLQYCARYFDQIIQVTLPQVKQVVAMRQRVATMMDELGLESLSGGATFYFFVSIDGYNGSSMEFAVNLLRERFVSVSPGSAYGESTDRFIRVSIGTESEERIWQALKIIKDFIDSGTERVS